MFLPCVEYRWTSIRYACRQLSGEEVATMLIDPTGALAREHINDLLASAAQHNLARQARRARAATGHHGSPLRLFAAGRGAAGCHPAPVAAC
jgi:hypothetical protein